MKLFLLERQGPEWFYDENNAFVIRAEHEEQARQLAAYRACDEGPDVWLNPVGTSCEEIDIQGSAGIILQDYRAA